MPADGGASQGEPGWLIVLPALATVLSAIAAVWFPLIAGPRYRLYYGPINWKRRDDGSWEVNVYLSGRGRRDITRQAFDECKPVEINIGVPIRELTGAVSSHEARRIVKHCTEGTRLLIGPGLIGRRQDLRFTMITDREPQCIACEESLIDVQVQLMEMAPRYRWLMLSFLVSSMYLVAAGSVIAVQVIIGEDSFPQIVASVIGFLLIGIWIFYRGNFPVPLK